MGLSQKKWTCCCRECNNCCKVQSPHHGHRSECVNTISQLGAESSWVPIVSPTAACQWRQQAFVWLQLAMISGGTFPKLPWYEFFPCYHMWGVTAGVLIRWQWSLKSDRKPKTYSHMVYICWCAWAAWCSPHSHISVNGIFKRNTSRCRWVRWKVDTTLISLTQGSDHHCSAWRLLWERGITSGCTLVERVHVRSKTLIPGQAETIQCVFDLYLTEV